MSYSTEVRKRPYRLTVRTPAFQAVNRGSIPRRVTKVATMRPAAHFALL